MYVVILTSVIMTLLSVLSSVVGGLLPFLTRIKNESYINILYQFVSGIMLGIVCISMIPESNEASSIIVTIFGIIIGVLIILLLDFLINSFSSNSKFNKLLLIISSMALHNIVEGIAIGASIEYSFSLGISIFIAMFLHDIPESMIIGVGSLDNKKTFKQILKNSIIVGLFSGIGIFMGVFFGSISDVYTGLSLSISSGAMLYIVTKTVIPDKQSEYNSYILSLSFIIGILLSAIITKI